MTTRVEAPRPVTAVLPAELVAGQKHWLGLEQAQRDAFYAKEFAAPFARLFADLPLHGAPATIGRPKALISVLGLSWQPVALMAAWARPQRMLVIGTERSLSLSVAGEDVLSLVCRVSGLSRDRIKSREVPDSGEVEIYRAVRDFLRSSDVQPREVFVDPTGGKKSMSASAALAGFLAGSPIVYVDYCEYQARAPVAGTEYPRLLEDPLQVLLDLELREVIAAFNRGVFTEAQHGAERIALRLYEPREAECLALLAAGYGAWDRFEFVDALSKLERAWDLQQRFAAQGKWTWVGTAEDQIRRNLDALRALARTDPEERPHTIEEGSPLIIWYLAAAQRHLQSGQPGLALLLTYVAVERYLNLCLLVQFGLEDDAPDYSRIRDHLDEKRYEDAGRGIYGKRYAPQKPDGQLMFRNGAQLLATLSPKLLDLKDLGLLQGLAEKRNKGAFAHGLRPKNVTEEEVTQFFKKACEIVARIRSGGLMGEIDACRFPVLSC